MRGGKRPGAGRPKGRFKKKKIFPQLMDGNQPIIAVAGDGQGGLGFKVLGNQPGVTVQSEAVRMPKTKRRGARDVYVAAQAKLPYWYQETDPDSTSYMGMHKWLAEYRRDALVRNCINALAFYATNKGFETVLEPVKKMDREETRRFIEQYSGLKEYVDETNKRVNLDRKIHVAIVKNKIFGYCGFEKLRSRGKVTELIPLDSEELSPIVGDDFQLIGLKYTYMAKEGDYYRPADVLYFTNNQLEADWMGLSAIEPVIHAVETRRILLQQAFKEASLVLWAGVGILNVNTEGMDAATAKAAITNFSNQIKPGKWITTNHRVTGEIYNLQPNLQALVTTIDYLDQDIVGNFRVPRFLIGRERQINRATAYCELEAFVNGPILDDQRYFRRELERQWYDPLAREYLMQEHRLGVNEELPVKVKHKWNVVTTSDFTELFRAITQAYAKGDGWLTRQKSWELGGLDWHELADESLKQYERPATEPKKNPRLEDVVNDQIEETQVGEAT